MVSTIEFLTIGSFLISSLVMNMRIMESISVDAVSVPRGWMDYVGPSIHRIELRYPGHRKFYFIVPKTLS